MTLVSHADRHDPGPFFENRASSGSSRSTSSLRTLPAGEWETVERGLTRRAA
jgi:hypothetical protein